MSSSSPLPSPALFALSLLPLLAGVQRTQEAVPDFAHDLGVPVREVVPRPAIPRAALERVAAHVGCAPEELAGIRLFTGTIVPRRGPERLEELVLVPLGGAARGGRLAFSASGGTAREMGLWGALDFDEDPTLRWSVFIEQLRDAGTHETGQATVGSVALAMEPARDVRARRAELAAGKDDDARLADAILRQRQVMRRNGIWVGMSRRGKERPAPEWLAELAAEMEALAKLSPVLEPVLGTNSAVQHARFARDTAAAYSDMAALLADDPHADLRELQQAMRPSCSGCHGNGNEWPGRAAAFREEMGLADTRLELGFDVAPTLGDHEGVSQQLADKVRAGLLLLEASRE